MTGTPQPGIYRELYPGAQSCVYLDVAAVGITSTRVRDAMVATIAGHEQHGIAGSAARAETMARVRAQVAALVGGDSRRVAFTQNTSTGMALVANGVAWSAGDNLLVPAGEFPSNFYPWTQLRRRGVEVRQIPMADGHARLDQVERLADDRTRLLAISTVQYSSGYRYALAGLGEFCRGAGILLVVDGTQSVGALTVDADGDGIDVLAVSAHKWLLGPLGVGFVHLSARAMADLHPSVVGWLSVEEPFAFDHEPRLAGDARRFESGTENAAGIAGMGAAVDLVLEAGSGRVEAHVLDRAGDLADVLAAAGWRLLRAPDPVHRSGIVIATTDGGDAEVFERLQLGGVRCSLRGGGVRFAPHYYTNGDDVTRVGEIVTP